ncbi:MAG: hypothetical protein ACT4P7_07955 [Gemmatimonadaceae bacterium]
MNLHGGSAYWLVANGLVPAPAPLMGNATCDVLSAGAGITGALLAHALTADGHGGNGITFRIIAAEVPPRSCAGQVHPDAR